MKDLFITLLLNCEHQNSSLKQFQKFKGRTLQYSKLKMT